MIFKTEVINEHHIKTFKILMKNASIILLIANYCVPIAHALIVEYDFRPRPEVIELFGILMTNQYYNLNLWVEYKPITVEHLNTKHTISIYGTSVSLALHFKQTGIFAVILF